MSTWKNRIVSRDNVSPDELLANPFNWRIHPRMQSDALTALLEEVGWLTDVIVNQNTGHVVDGHLRVIQALENKQDTVPVSYLDLTEAEEALILAALDTTAGMAVYDDDKTQLLLQQVQTKHATLDSVLADLKASTLTLSKQTFKPSQIPMRQLSVDYKVVLGPYRFDVDGERYTRWISELYNKVGTDTKAVLKELQSRLGLDEFSA